MGKKENIRYDTYRMAFVLFVKSGVWDKKTLAPFDTATLHYLFNDIPLLRQNTFDNIFTLQALL